MRPPKIARDSLLHSSPNLVQQAVNGVVADQIRWVPLEIVIGAVRLADWSFGLPGSQVVAQAKRLDRVLGPQLEAVNAWTGPQEIPSLLSIYEAAKIKNDRGAAVIQLRRHVAEHGFFEAYNDRWNRYGSMMMRGRVSRGMRFSVAAHRFFENNVKGYDEQVDERLEGGILASRMVGKMFEIKSQE